MFWFTALSLNNIFKLINNSSSSVEISTQHHMRHLIDLASCGIFVYKDSAPKSFAIRNEYELSLDTIMGYLRTTTRTTATKMYLPMSLTKRKKKQREVEEKKVQFCKVATLRCKIAAVKICALLNEHLFQSFF